MAIPQDPAEWISPEQLQKMMTELHTRPTLVGDIIRHQPCGACDGTRVDRDQVPPEDRCHVCGGTGVVYPDPLARLPDTIPIKRRHPVAQEAQPHTFDGPFRVEYVERIVPLDDPTRERIQHMRDHCPDYRYEGE